MSDVRLKTALLSVSDKSDLVGLAETLNSHGVHMMSTGGTFKQLSEAGFDVQEVSDYTGFPEMMDGRVKTLHPKVHGGLLGRRGTDDSVMAEHDIRGIDLLVVNLYPFEETVAKDPSNTPEIIENIDIGGPAMLRSAAKNFESVAVVVDPSDYADLVEELNRTGGSLSAETRFKLAVKAFEMVARYDAAIANHLSSLTSSDSYSDSLTVQFKRQQSLRYGENPHQSAAFYVERNPAAGSVASATQHQGKELSYNNIADTDAALQCVQSFDEPACVIVKHANPCGVAQSADVMQAYDRAFKTDPTSAFGGIIAFNREVDEKLAAEITERQFSEVIAAPAFTESALGVFKGKKNVRILQVTDAVGSSAQTVDYKRVAGGLLVQDADIPLLDEENLRVVTKREPSDKEYQDLMFAWKVSKYVKSNAIVYAKDLMTIGVGAGQMARVTSAIIAGIKAGNEGLEVRGSVMASDAFFPFRDSIDAASEEGITAIVQPGGSMRDQEVIDAADEAGMTMVFTGMRHFRH